MTSLATRCIYEAASFLASFVRDVTDAEEEKTFFFAFLSNKGKHRINLNESSAEKKPQLCISYLGRFLPRSVFRSFVRSTGLKSRENELMHHSLLFALASCSREERKKVKTS